MIGEIHEIDGKIYVEMNNKGTLERMPTLKWYWVIILYLKDYFKKMRYGEIKQWIYEHSHNVWRGK